MQETAIMPGKELANSGRAVVANFISYDACPQVASTQMSNGLMSCFVGVLSLAASALATSDRQRELAAWLASHDQGFAGSGMVGFDVAELPWSAETFASDRDFLIQVIEAAKRKTGWEHLGYEPDEVLLLPCLDGFKTMVGAFSIEHASQSESQIRPFGGKPTQLALCPIHEVYQHLHGCPLCNDA